MWNCPALLYLQSQLRNTRKLITCGKAVALREPLQLQGSIILTVAATSPYYLFCGSNNKCFNVKTTHRIVPYCLQRKTNGPTAPWCSLFKTTARKLKLAKQLSVTKAEPSPLCCHLALCTSTVPMDLPLYSTFVSKNLVKWARFYSWLCHRIILQHERNLKGDLQDQIFHLFNVDISTSPCTSQGDLHVSTCYSLQRNWDPRIEI